MKLASSLPAGSWRHNGPESSPLPSCADRLSACADRLSACATTSETRMAVVAKLAQGRKGGPKSGMHQVKTNSHNSLRFTQQRWSLASLLSSWQQQQPRSRPRLGNYVVNAFNESSYEDVNDSSFPPALDEVLDYLDEQKQEQGGKGGATENEDYWKRDSEERGYEGVFVRVEEGYVGLFVRLLGLDNPEEGREEAVQALCRHSAGGKEFIDEILAFPGCLNLVVLLLSSERPDSSLAAAGLLRNVSSVAEYRSVVYRAGALEEIAGLLTRRASSSEVKERAAFVLWNLSGEEGSTRVLMEPEVLRELVIMLSSEIVGEREASAGVIGNLALKGALTHDILVDAGIIRRLAGILLSGKEESKVVRQEVRKTLLELAGDEYVKLLIIEEGLVPVPSLGASAYQSFKPLLQEAPTLPEEVSWPESKVESKFGAGELLLGLNLENPEVDNETQLNIEGKVRQQFLARIGLLGKNSGESAQIGGQKFTLLPWWDGIPRLILILGLDDLAVAAQAARTIAEIAILDGNRQAVLKGGAIPRLVVLLGSGDADATAAAAFALDKLAISSKLRESIYAHDAVSALNAVLKAEDAPEYVKEKVQGALSRLSQTKDEAIADFIDSVGSNLGGDGESEN